MRDRYRHKDTDSYTGLPWCGRALHLLDEQAKNASGQCRRCAARYRAEYRKKNKASTAQPGSPGTGELIAAIAPAARASEVGTAGTPRRSPAA